MSQKIDLNVAPYYDDYSGENNFVKTLFRPGFAIQARELTQLQSQLQGQIEAHGTHIFKEGAMVIPGQLSFNSEYHSLKLTSTFSGETIDPSQYYSATSPVTITGATTGVTAVIIGYDVATTTDQPTLYLRYIKTGTDTFTKKFADGENISASAGITHTTAYSSDAVSATTYTSIYSEAAGSTVAQLNGSTGPAAGTGAAASIQPGIYYIRGFFVECSEETLVLSKYENKVDGRIGFTITEALTTPESDTSLLDNATGSTNYAAKGAHRLKYTLALAKLDLGSSADSSFIELMNIDSGVLNSLVNKTEYNILEHTLARRTYDESGDYTVRPFTVRMKESNTLNENIGVYDNGARTDDDAVSSNSLLTVQVSTGKAYVRGYEIEKIAATFKDLSKARDFETVNAGITTFNMGNYTLINNVYGSPDISSISGETTAYKTISLYDHFTTTRGSIPALTSSANTQYPIGQCRARAIEYDSGTVGTNDAKYKVYLFDIRMFTYITLSGTPSPTLLANWSNGGVKITGSSSGATGFVVNNIATTTGTRLVLIKTSGRFSNGETFTASDSAETGGIVENSSNTDLTMDAASGQDADRTHTFEQVRSMTMVDSDTGQNFTADVVLDVRQNRANQLNNLTLDGTDTGSANVNNQFSFDTGDADPSGTVELETDLVPRLVNPDQNNGLEKLPKQVIKTLLTTTNSGLTDTQYTIRRQFIGTTNSSGVVTFNASSNETFVTHAEKDYVMSILTAGGGTGSQGDLVSISSTISGTGTVTITITDSTILGNAAKVKLTATILKTSVNPKLKTTKLMKQLKVSTGATDAYGTRPTDREISLGRGDVFKLVGVYDSQDTSTDAVAPTLTVGTITATFTRGEKITGGTSGATGRIITIASPISYVSTNSKTFTASEKITGESSAATATTSAVTTGDTVITSRYLLDTGQRDNFYDIARIVRKTGQAAPIGKLLVVYDYLEHGSGDMFTVDSYSDVAKQMEYDDIPIYTATKIDVTDPKPSGQFPLYSSYDFRPRVDDITGTNTDLATVDEVTGNSFNFYTRTFEGTGGATVDFPKPGSFIQSDFEYYLPKFATLILESRGNFRIVEGEGAENPLLPKVPEDSMLICSMFLPAYTFDPTNVTIRREKHQRYTMRDIGKLARRIDHVEYYTALSLLERDAESFEVTDANGLNRFKSGFMVDNFKGHRIGDTAHRDYKNSMDFELGQLRPKHKAKSIALEEKVSTDTDRTAAGYQKTGDLITLPYTEIEIVTQPYATRIERVNPFLTANWGGIIELSPSADEWFETEVLPDLIINEEGDYDAVLAQQANNLGSVWNSWQTQWSGVVETRTDNWIEGGTQLQPDRFDVTRTTQTVRTDQTRTGVNTQVSLRVDRVSQGLRVVSQAAIPVMRSKTITFTGENFKPNTRIYPFFNKTAVSSNVTPSSTDYTTDATPAAGSPLITTAIGKIVGTFTIPDPTVVGNVTFPTGNIEFKLTSSSWNGVTASANEAGTSGTTIYSATGLLETQQETIIATRNAEISQTAVSGNTSFNTITSRDLRTASGNFLEEQAAAEAARAAAAAAAAATAAEAAAATAAQNTQQVRFGTPANRVWSGKGGWVVRQAPGGFQGGRPGPASSPSPDPVAQTFKLPGDASGSSNGAFVTSVDIFFSDKDESIPITLELRNTVNGYPGPKVLPFGRVVKNVGDINTSSTAATATTFTFPSPVYLETETEYCVVVISNTPEHKIWIARMGETDIDGTRTISDQPHAGILYKSHNNTGWAISPMEDMKFSIKCASFDQTDAVCTLTNSDIPVKKLSADPIFITDASTTLKINHSDHHMYATSNNVTIAGTVSGATTTLDGAITAAATTLTLTNGTNFDDTTGTYAQLAAGTWYIKIDDEILTYTTISTNAVSGLTRGVNSTTAAVHTDDATVELYQVYKVPLTEINKTHTAIANPEIDSYTVTCSTTPDVGTSDTAAVGGTVVTATENAIMDYFSTIIGLLELPNTGISAKALVVRGTSPSGSQTSYLNTRDDTEVPTISFPLNDNYKFDVPYMITSDINETNELSGLRSLELQLTMTTNSVRLSPVIDTGRMSMITVANRLNNIDSSSDVYPTADHVPSTHPDGDQNAAIYLTKQVTLDSLASGLKVIFASHRPSTNDIKVMYKILRIDESSDFDDLGYTYFNSDGSPDTTVGASAGLNDFQEYRYSAGVTDDGIGTPLEDFISFQIKIIMQGTNCAEPPRIKSLRVLALGT